MRVSELFAALWSLRRVIPAITRERHLKCFQHGDRLPSRRQ